MAQNLHHRGGSKTEPGNDAKRYGRIPKNVLTDKHLSASARLVYAFLSMWVFQGKTCRKGQRYIAEQLGLARNTVAGAINELIEYEHIRVERLGRERTIYELASSVFGQKQGKKDVLVSGPSGVPRYVSLDHEREFGKAV